MYFVEKTVVLTFILLLILSLTAISNTSDMEIALSDVTNVVEVPEKYKPYVGKYIATYKNEQMDVLVQNGHLAFDIPEQGVIELRDPDQDGKWYFSITDKVAVIFEKNDKNEVVAMKILQTNLELELLREGYTPSAEVELKELEKYVGNYRADFLNANIKVLIQNNRLALDVPGQIIYELYPPDKDGMWSFRAANQIKVKFNKTNDGKIDSMTVYQAGQEFKAPRIKDEGVKSEETDKNPFPSDTPESQGLSSEALKKLSDVVQGYVDDDQIIGAEFVVIKNRKTVLHEVYGWKDREDKIPMAPNTIFNIRSMTKPITGTLAQMLIEEGKLALDDPVSKYLPSFDNDKSRKITIEQLLTHRSGLPLALLTGEIKEDETLQDIAKKAGENGPEIEPGTAFHYSDTGSDTLGAIIEKVSGMSLDKFVKQRIIKPLGMADTIALVKDDPKSDRICSAYFGKKGEWLRYWKPGDRPIYPFAMGSQSLYCTPIDYARFLALWMDNGKIGDKQIITQETVKQSLTSVSDMTYATSFADLKTYYGRMWIVYASDKSKLEIFGHDGSDGTFSWVWPEHDLIILFFTQSRGNASGISLEADIDRLLIHPDTVSVAVTEDFKPYLGKYITDYQSTRNNEYLILEKDGQLAVQIPQETVIKLMPPDAEGKRRFTISQEVAISFERDSDDNVATMLIHQNIPLQKGTVSKSELKDIPEKYKPYVGTYFISMPGQGKLDFAVLIQNGNLAVKYPEGKVHELKEPDKNGKWGIYDIEREGFAFVRDSTDKVIAMKMLQVSELKRGALPPELPLDLEQVKKYLGIYRDEKTGQDVEIIINNDHLAIKIPTIEVPLEFFSPDANGFWVMRLSPSTSIHFNEKDGKVISYTAYGPGGEAVRIKVEK